MWGESNIMNIVIDGNIGCGKTTVLNNLKTSLSRESFYIKEENVTEWKPYLLQFYNDMNKYSLSFQMKVLHHHLLNPTKCYKENMDKCDILERSPLSCIHIFGQNLLDSNMVSELDMKLMVDYNKSFGWEPDNIIYINTDPEICLERINKRNRDGESSIPLDYLKSIHNLYQKLYVDKLYEKYVDLPDRVKIFIIDGNRDSIEVYNDVRKIINDLYLENFKG